MPPQQQQGQGQRLCVLRFSVQPFLLKALWESFFRFGRNIHLRNKGELIRIQWSKVNATVRPQKRPLRTISVNLSQMSNVAWPFDILYPNWQRSTSLWHHNVLGNASALTSFTKGMLWSSVIMKEILFLSNRPFSGDTKPCGSNSSFHSFDL